MKCIIVDDEYKSIDLLKGYVIDVPFLTLLETFRNPLQAIDYINHHEVDLVFLDINMPRLTGIEFVKALHKKTLVIFTTAYAQHAVVGFELDVVDYILKPITFDRFLKAVNKAKSMFETANPIAPQEFVLIKSGPQTYQVRRDEILYIEKDANYATIHTASTKIVTRSNFDEVMAMVGEKDMIRVHKSFVVNVNRITMIESNELTIGKVAIPIGATYKEAFLTMMRR